jgi:hypothetical protein
MSTISVILEPAADGTLHLPVPAEWRNRRIRVKAEMEPLGASQGQHPVSLPESEAPEPGCLKGFRMSPDYDEPLEEFSEYMQ